jgi:hypothetical protein
MSNFGALSDAMDWLLNQCRVLERQNLSLYLKFEHDNFIQLQSDEALMMAVEMTVRYYESTLDPNVYPSWMDVMDSAWKEADETPEEEEESEDSQSDDSDCYFYT